MKKFKFLEKLLPNDFYILDLLKASHAIFLTLLIGLFIIVFKAPSYIEITDSFYTLAKNVIVGFFVIYVVVALPRMS